MTRVLGRRGARLACALLLTAAVAGCGDDGGYEPRGDWRPLPEGAPPQVAPPTEGQVPPPGSPPSGGGSEPGSSDEDPNVVASGLNVPTGLVLMPDGTALVGERETGRILQVFPDRSPDRELMVVPGIDTAGDGGLYGLALSPTFGEDGLVYAYLSTPTDNRVVRFPIGGTPNPVLTGIPRGEVHNGGALLFDLEGSLYIGTGDTGNPALAQDPASLAGKVLRVDVFGQPVDGTAVFGRGFSNVTALCVSGDETLYATDDASGLPDELTEVVRGADAGFPTEGANSTPPVQRIDDAAGGLAGCAAAGPTIHLGALEGRRIYSVTLDGSGAPVAEPEELLPDEYGRLRTVVLEQQTGALWITTSNRDGAGQPAEDDDKVLRILPPGASGEQSPL
ncbi:sorbosone dehydrogenase family protein [Blastococcus sp. URHD0036]|uniref:PQQ-dependent sugar dehydrogenase n=1 Tax=Blastococcus sp. URHD0036 TaxID=1380356 RepID=UPI0004975BE5|nr:PQQ-dependent sugar dehydrogenase [Blastococcus sp. URHD0036]